MKKRPALLSFILIIVLSLSILSSSKCFSVPYYETERISSFHSDIIINKDGTMTVTENIEVYSTGNAIKRGIYRDFPTKYADQFGNRYVVGFEVVEVLRDGVDETYHIENMINGKRIKIGESDSFLSTGKHSYSITYNTSRQIGFFENHDELFWNVTGLGWKFPIEKASALVTLPTDIPVESVTLDGYTGPEKATYKNFKAFFNNEGKANFVTTESLKEEEGLTILVKWPKGYVTQPTFTDKTIYFFKDNIIPLAGLLGLLAILVFYLYIWNKFGRDPKKGTIIPLFAPPRDLSPAGMRYIRRMGFDNKSFTAAVLSMAVKGYLKIEEAGRNYVLRKGNVDDAVLSSDEKDAANAFISSERGPEYVVELKQSNHVIIKNAISVLQDSLISSYKSLCFITNSRYSVIAVLLSVATMLLPLLIFNDGVTPLFVVIVIAHVLVHIVFAVLLKAPTPEGRKIMDDIEGFKMFLSVTEKERMNLLNPPEKTPELFEKYLPYAIALDVENEWGKQFSDVFERIAKEGHEYAPSWYHGSRWNMHKVTSFAPSLANSFSSAIASSSTPPGSKSGSFGGYSGGGGGGGGGGGW